MHYSIKVNFSRNSWKKHKKNLFGKLLYFDCKLYNQKITRQHYIYEEL